MGVVAKLKDTKRAWANEATAYLVYCAVAFAFGDLLFGVDTGSFGSIQALPAFIDAFAPIGANGKKAFSTKTRSIMNSVVWPGKFLGTLVFDPLVERVGYKNSMYLVAVLQSVALIVELTAKTWQTFAGGRVIAYFAVGIVENVVPCYLSEIAPASLRGFFAGIMNIVVACGNLWGSGMGRAYSTETKRIGWIVPVAVQFIPVLFIIALVPFCQESPRWLVTKGRKEDAVIALNRIRPKKDIQDGVTFAEVDALEEAVTENDAQKQGQWIELLKPTYFKRCLVAILVFFLNQSSGNQFINLYGPVFFKQIGLTTLAFSYTMMITAIGIGAAIFAVCVVDIVGRRTILLIGIGLAAIFNAVVGGVGSHKTLSDTDIHAIVASLVFVSVGNKTSVNPLCYVISAELGGIKMRKKILAIGAAADVVFAFVMSYSIPYLIGIPGANLGAKVGFFFMGICIFGWFAILLFVPELTGRSLEEVDELFERKIWAWQFDKAETYGVGRRIAQLERGTNEGIEGRELFGSERGREGGSPDNSALKV